MEYINSKIYQAFLAAGVDEETASAAAESIPGAFDFPTKTEFASMRTDFEGMKSDFQELNIRLVRVVETNFEDTFMAVGGQPSWRVRNPCQAVDWRIIY